MKNIVLPVFILVFFSISISAYGLGIGVSPTKAWVNLSNNKLEMMLPIRLSNPSTENVTMQILPNQNLRNFISCENYYWCDNQTYLITPNYTLSNPYIVNVLFKKFDDYNASFDDYIYVTAQGTGKGGMIGIKPQIQIKVSLNQEGKYNWNTTENQTIILNQTATYTNCSSLQLYDKSQEGQTCVRIQIKDLICYQCSPKETNENTTTNIGNDNNNTENKNLLSPETIIILGVISCLVIVGGAYYIKNKSETTGKSGLFS